MSRDKFEEWWGKWHDFCDDKRINLAYQCWLAGRESMRDEAADICNQMWEKCDSIVKRVNNGLDNDVAYYAATNACDDCESEIKKIKP